MADPHAEESKRLVKALPEESIFSVFQPANRYAECHCEVLQIIKKISELEKECTAAKFSPQHNKCSKEMLGMLKHLVTLLDQSRTDQKVSQIAQLRSRLDQGFSERGALEAELLLASELADAQAVLSRSQSRTAFRLESLNNCVCQPLTWQQQQTQLGLSCRAAPKMSSQPSATLTSHTVMASREQQMQNTRSHAPAAAKATLSQSVPVQACALSSSLASSCAGEERIEQSVARVRKLVSRWSAEISR